MKKILLIEDDLFLGEVLMRKLKTEGYEATLARDGKEGLGKLSEVKPDLLLLDIILPSMNGYEILEAKSKDPLIKDIPTIVISNSGQPVEISRILTLGVKDYIVKAQFDPQDVITKVKKQLEAEEVAHVADNGGGLNGKKIMWVEDDKFLSDIAMRKLSTQNCTLVHVTTGEEALGRIESDMPDIVVLDLLLPGMTGFQILQSIKSNPKIKHIPVILLSNLGQESDVEKGETLGAVRFLIKATVTLDEIVREIKKVLVK
ncbi:MAG: response regulator [Candidatus Taylorbacteria bacterium]|nr:response regulator [Candidatus Taylorbacteria bacterium]